MGSIGDRAIKGFVIGDLATVLDATSVLNTNTIATVESHLIKNMCKNTLKIFLN